MATPAAVAEPIPAIVVDESHLTADATSTVSTWQTPTAAVHPQAGNIVRQIDYYFSDDNLRQDAHLLGLFQEGKGTVSLNEVLSFKKMRKFKPKPAVKEAVKGSTLVEIVRVGTKDRLRLRKAPQKPITVIPKINADRNKYVVPEDQPWLTKGMLKPTGFEEFATEGPIAPAEYEEDRREYDRDNAFTERIETAVRKFNARRKMHQQTRLIFEKYMIYGGMDAGTQFTGGLDEAAKGEMTKKEIAEMSVRYQVSERVLDGLADDLGGEGGETPSYVVDFEASAKGFLSSQLLAICNWYDGTQVVMATNVLRNFYNYLLLHDVCSEYNAQLHAARKVCDLAEEELLKLAMVDPHLPGGFNKACSTLFDGNYAKLNAPVGDWVVEGDNIGWTREEAKTVFLTGIFAYGNEEQLKKIEQINESGEDLTQAIKVVNEEESIGLEVVAIEPATELARKVYGDIRFTGTIVKPMGKLHCKRWTVPHAKRDDLPASVLQARKNDNKFEFLLDDELLQHCFPGMKIEACVKELSIGIKFIDHYQTGYVSFFTWLWNERIREWKQPGPPTAWMERANATKRGGAFGEPLADGEDGPGDGEMPD